MSGYVWKGDPAKAAPKDTRTRKERSRDSSRAYYLRNREAINAKRRTPEERAKRRARRAAKRHEDVHVLAHPKCGTNAGYQRHMREGEEPCFDCRNAHAVAAKKYRTASPSTVDTHPEGCVESEHQPRSTEQGSTP